MLRHQSNFTTNKTTVNTEQRVYHCQSDSSEHTAGLAWYTRIVWLHIYDIITNRLIGNVLYFRKS